MTYLLRVNLDIGTTNVAQNLRFKNTLNSIGSLTKGSHKIVILAHRGRPTKKDSSLSLRPFVAPLSKGLKRKVTLINHFDFKRISQQIKNSPSGSIFLLENLRFMPGEYKASKTLARSLASLGDKFINDDFPTSHHKNASNYELPKLLPSTLGPNFKAELLHLDRVMRNPRKPFVLVIGGAKTADKLGVLKSFINKADTILLGGGPANTFLKARGVQIGKSIYDPSALRQIGSLVARAKIVTPVDWKVKKEAILDLGPATMKLYRETIRGAKTIVWNGPLGKFEDKSFAGATNALYKAILGQKGANILIGGGDTLEAIADLGKAPRHVFVSSGGGAMLTYLSGEGLPAIQAIKR